MNRIPDMKNLNFKSRLAHHIISPKSKDLGLIYFSANFSGMIDLKEITLSGVSSALSEQLLYQMSTFRTAFLTCPGEPASMPGRCASSGSTTI